MSTRADRLKINESLVHLCFILLLSLVVGILLYRIYPFYPPYKAATQELYKGILSVSSVLLAFSPAFYVFLYSNKELVDLAKSLKFKETLDYRFRIFTVSSFILMILSLISIFLSYSNSAKAPEILNDTLNRINLSTVTALLVFSMSYLYLYGRTVLVIIRELV